MRKGGFKYAYPRKRGPRRYGSYGAGKGKGKVRGQYQMSSSARGYLRVGGYYGRFANGGELKFHDVDLDDAVVAAGGTITPTVNIIPQGVLENNRVGRKCTIKSINWRMRIALPAVNQGNPGADTVRIIMYVDKQTNGAAATALNILQTDDFQSFRNLENVGRFVILYDHTLNLETKAGAYDGTGTDWGGDVETRSFYKKCNIPIEYDNSASTGVLTTIRSNNIGVLLLSENGQTAFGSKIRLRFSDT